MSYADELVDNETMHWFTKSPRTLSSPEVKKLQDPDSWTFRVFVKKSDDEGTDFYYLGEVIPVQDTIRQVEKPLQDGRLKSVVEMMLKFKTPIERTLFNYLTLNEN